MAAFSEYKIMDATSLAQLVRKKEVKPMELVEAALFRLASQLERTKSLGPKRDPWLRDKQ